MSGIFARQLTDVSAAETRFFTNSALCCSVDDDLSFRARSDGDDETTTGEIMREMDRLRLMTLNVNGAGGLQKQLEIESLASEADIIFFQETHGHKVPLGNGWIIVDNVFKNKSVVKQCKGVAIAMRRSLLHTEPDVRLLWTLPARAIAISARLVSGRLIKLASLYFPNVVSEQIAFTEHIDWTKISGCIWGCDSNMTTRPGESGKRKKDFRPFEIKSSAQIFSGLLMQHRICDAWLLGFPIDDKMTEKRGTIPFTHKQRGNGRANCIDRIAFPNAMAGFFDSIVTRATSKSDHEAVIVTLINSTNQSARPFRPAAVRADWLTGGDWAEIADSLCASEEAAARSGATARERFAELVLCAKNVARRRLWALQREDLEDSRNFQRQIKDCQDRIERVLRRERTGCARGSDAAMLKRARKHLGQLYDKRIVIERRREVQFVHRQHVDVKQIWQEQRRQSARHAHTPRIGSCIGGDGSVHTDDDMIENVFVSHLEQVGSPARPLQTNIDRATAEVLDATPSFADLVGGIGTVLSVKEIAIALELCSADPGSSAGTDGLNYMFYRYLRKVIHNRRRAAFIGPEREGDEHDDAVTRLLTACWAERLLHGLPSFWYETIVTILHKGGERRSAANYRPISLMSCAFKVITRALLGKLKSVLPHIINEEQHAYVEGRDTIGAVATIVDVCAMARSDRTSRPGEALMVYQFDFVKAYDTISRDFIAAVLGKIGFNVEFVSAIRSFVLSDLATNSLVLNGRMTRLYQTSHGIRQGDCLSTVLYVLAVSPLFELFRRRGVRGFRIPSLLSEGREESILGSSFADDTIGLVSGRADVFAMAGALDVFAVASSQVTSPTKSLCGIVADRDDVFDVDSLPKIASLVDSSLDPGDPRCVEEWILLGIPLRSADMYPVASRIGSIVIKSVSDMASKWSGSRLSLAERAVVFNTAWRAKMSYFARLIPLSAVVCDAVDRMGASFIDPVSHDSVPLPDCMIFGDGSAGGLSNNGVGKSYARVVALLARRVIKWVEAAPDSWLRRRCAPAWRLAMMQLHEITGSRPSLTCSMPLSHLFDSAGELIDRTLSSLAWSLCAVHELRLRRKIESGPLLFDVALTSRAWRAPMLGGGPRPVSLAATGCTRVLHLYRLDAWQADVWSDDGEPRFPNPRKPARSVLQMISTEHQRCGLGQSVQRLHQRSQMLDTAVRAMRQQWSELDLVMIERHFVGRLVGHFDLSPTSGAPYRRVREVLISCGIVDRISIDRTANADQSVSTTLFFEVRSLTSPLSEPHEWECGSLGRLERPVAGVQARLGDRIGSVNGVVLPTTVLVDCSGATSRVDAASTWRLDVDDGGSVFLLDDLVESRSEELWCTSGTQIQLMELSRLTREEQERDGVRMVGDGRDRTIQMAFNRTELAYVERWPKRVLKVKDLTTSVMTQRARLLLEVGDPDWRDRDESLAWCHFVKPWTDMHDAGLSLSLAEKDFVRRLVTDRFWALPYGWGDCPMCGAGPQLVNGRHLVFVCPTLIRLRDLLVGEAVARGWASQAMVVDAWVWRMRPRCRLGEDQANHRRRLAAIRLVLRTQLEMRRAVWLRFGGAIGRDKPLGFADQAEELQLVRKVADAVVAGFLQ
jgi:hypothetical protein